ncbi:MAG: cytidylate kinase [Candidatus Marinimicrobia bacterium]|nr:cytidylate kinase [Candidatus Neomarinimicrobiota bacterium]
MIVAIDGPAGSGKSTTSRRVADRLGFLYLDTGAMYRAATLAVLSDSANLKDDEGIGASAESMEIDFDRSGCRIFLNGLDVSRDIRSQEVTDAVSTVSAFAIVRERMVDLQRKIAGNRDAVVEGRDIGTVVFPNANCKFFIVADVTERAKRRKKDLAELGIELTVEQIVEDLKRRDKLDSSRPISPLQRADDAVEIDTTDMTMDEQVDLIVTNVRERLDRKEMKKSSD